MKPSRQISEVTKVVREEFPAGKTAMPSGLRAFLLFGQIITGIFSTGLWLTNVAKLFSHL